MKLNSVFPTGRSGTRCKAALLSVFVAALMAVLVPLSGGLSAAHAATATGSFDNVQVTIQTSSSLPDSYSVSAYNMTGGLVASYQSQYPAAAFELPSGAYIFTATATIPEAVIFPPIAVSSTATAEGSSGASAGPMIKCCAPPMTCCVTFPQPPVEYGYVSQQVSGPTSLTISTEPINQTSTSTLSIQVSYPNGTLASGVYVSASVLGDNSGWAYASNVTSMSNTTDAQGTATLVTPTAPVLVTASASVPIVLPYNQSTIQVTVGGVKVNVTANWEPNQVSFSGQTLIIPPQTSAAITLQYQPQYPGPIVYATGQSAPGKTTGGTGPTTVASRISSDPLPPPTQSAAGTHDAPSNASNYLVYGVAAALAVAALSGVLFARSRPKTSAR
jgi:hypothetical protein